VASLLPYEAPAKPFEAQKDKKDTEITQRALLIMFFTKSQFALGIDGKLRKGVGNVGRSMLIIGKLGHL
jgi:hypothetical protein